MSEDDKSRAISDVVQGMDPAELFGKPLTVASLMEPLTFEDLEKARPDLVRAAQQAMPGMPQVDLGWADDLLTEIMYDDEEEGLGEYRVIDDIGYVRLDAIMGSDLTIVNAAKVSFANRAEHFGEVERKILEFLMKYRHGSPSEHVTLRFTTRAPLFVNYEWHRHRAGHSYNEESARYTTMRPDFRSYKAYEITTQVGRPGRYTFEPMHEQTFEEGMTGVERAAEAESIMDLAQRFAFREYRRLLDMGVAPQQARIVLPVGMYKEQVWTCNARSLMHFLSLRMDKNAQSDIRAYAHAIYRLAKMVLPHTMDDFANRGFVAP